jgi:soluble lytic murein transglycosylase
MPAADAAVSATAEGNSPYAPQLQELYENENPDLLDLVSRVEHQESSGDQSKVSKKGARGVMQVMPDTAPEAAQLAGLPWDENAYKTDPAYNKLLGIAYLSELLRKYNGNVAKALAAYNAGPNKVDAALHLGGDDDFLSYLPGETQDYVARVG